MKRPLIIIVIFLLLGAVVNVAVAWGIAIWSPQRAKYFSTVTQSDIHVMLVRHELGWPERGLRSEELLWWENGWPQREIAEGWHLQDVPLIGSRSKIILPLAPVWPGFAINTIFYATILWLLIPGPVVLRRFLRVRRGLCPKCAYPMGESLLSCP